MQGRIPSALHDCIPPADGLVHVSSCLLPGLLFLASVAVLFFWSGRSLFHRCILTIANSLTLLTKLAPFRSLDIRLTFTFIRPLVYSHHASF